MTRISRALGLGATIAGLAVAGLAAPAAAVDSSLNKVSTWEYKTGGTCHKYEFADGKKHYVLGRWGSDGGRHVGRSVKVVGAVAVKWLRGGWGRRVVVVEFGVGRWAAR